MAPKANKYDYILKRKKVPQVNACKYIGIILSSNLGWEKQVN